MNFHTPDLVRLQRSVRDARHKLLLTLNPREGEPALGLYDLRDDPWENRNLANEPSFAPVRARLEAALLKWRTETADPLLDAARAERWVAAGQKWGQGPREKLGAYQVVRVPPGEQHLLD
jgi:arylsulfatase A-like enzyme